MSLDGEVNFEAGKYTETEMIELKNVKQLASLEKYLARHYCGKFEIKETESCWEVYCVNADGTSQKWDNVIKREGGSRFVHYVRVFAESIRSPYGKTDEITEVIKHGNGNLSEYFFMKPCLADDGKQGIEIALTQEYNLLFNL